MTIITEVIPIGRLTKERGDFVTLYQGVEVRSLVEGYGEDIFQKVINRLAEYEDINESPRELRHDFVDARAVVEKHEALKERYIDLLKKCGEDPCQECEHYVKCGPSCPGFRKGAGAYTANSEYLPIAWSCMDFSKCPRIEGTPCDGCAENGFSGFVLKE